ncbi:MAG TPA: class I SAM-dependent methyltransferase [Acidobacteriota bacterium]|nr:class I SAM-dependent methyltransferase [Acidobacteriota bacterium]HQM64940.1 class I SAM-dependent methyltransferase [Acidobacteriota bacterium]
MGRIKHERVQINPKDVNDFFDRRGRSVNRNHELTSILYQDSNPELAESRDRHEKQTILPLLALAPSDTVLDIGCGIGRWADAVISHVHMYHGIDFSSSLIEYACSRLGQTPNVTFQVLAAQDVSPERIAVNTRFSLIIISGLLIYLNDEVCEQTLANITTCCETSARIYIREPVGLESRLSLVNYYSEELHTHYNAIYRTEAELFELFNRTILARGFKLGVRDFLYPPEMNNRPETRQMFFIFSR